MIHFVLIQIHHIILMMLGKQIEVIMNLYHSQLYISRSSIDYGEVYHDFLFQFILLLELEVVIEYDECFNGIYSVTIWIPNQYCLIII